MVVYETIRNSLVHKVAGALKALAFQIRTGGLNVADPCLNAINETV